VGTEDVFLGLSGVDPSSSHCQEMLYKIELPNTNLKDIQIDLNEKQMVLQTKKYYLAQYFQYKTDYKRAKAEFLSDKGVLKLTLPVIRDTDY
jgi:HSP20 family molecular chaperone IbpA